MVTVGCASSTSWAGEEGLVAASALDIVQENVNSGRSTGKHTTGEVRGSEGGADGEGGLEFINYPYRKPARLPQPCNKIVQQPCYNLVTSYKVCN